MNQNAIEIKGLTKHFKKFSLGPLDLEVPQGSVYGFIGPNGAGKTTTIELIFRMFAADQGRVRILGLDAETDEVSVKQRVALVSPDLNYVSWGTIANVVVFIRRFYPSWDQDYADSLMRSFQLEPKARIANLSFGEKMKLHLLLALARRPQVLFLDEPTLGLDPVSKQEMLAQVFQLIESGQGTVFISSHQLTELERIADHIGFIKNGQMILQGPTAEILNRFRMAMFNSDHALKPEAGIWVQETRAGRSRALVDFQVVPENQFQNRVSGLDLRPVTLEDLFLGLVKKEVHEN